MVSGSAPKSMSKFSFTLQVNLEHMHWAMPYMNGKPSKSPSTWKKKTLFSKFSQKGDFYKSNSEWVFDRRNKWQTGSNQCEHAAHFLLQRHLLIFLHRILV